MLRALLGRARHIDTAPAARRDAMVPLHLALILQRFTEPPVTPLCVDRPPLHDLAHKRPERLAPHGGYLDLRTEHGLGCSCCAGLLWPQPFENVAVVRVDGTLYRRADAAEAFLDTLEAREERAHIAQLPPTQFGIRRDVLAEDHVQPDK